MVKRLFDLILSVVGLIITFPLFVIATVGIYFSSKGPIFFKTKRVGYKGELFTLYKFRTMHITHGQFFSKITAKDDPRIFKFGAWLRKLKIDELPQLINIIKGEMSIIGPRPEDPEIVEKYYFPEYFEVFEVKPGLASPGSIYNYTHGEKLLKKSDSLEEVYAKNLLPIKIALEIVYIREQSMLYDIKIIFRTIIVILSKILGKEEFPEPPEMKKAKEILLSWQLKKIFRHSRKFNEVYSYGKEKDKSSICSS